MARALAERIALSLPLCVFHRVRVAGVVVNLPFTFRDEVGTLAVMASKVSSCGDQMSCDQSPIFGQLAGRGAKVRTSDPLLTSRSTMAPPSSAATKRLSGEKAQ